MAHRLEELREAHVEATDMLAMEVEEALMDKEDAEARVEAVERAAARAAKVCRPSATAALGQQSAANSQQPLASSLLSLSP